MRIQLDTDGIKLPRDHVKGSHNKHDTSSNKDCHLADILTDKKRNAKAEAKDKHRANKHEQDHNKENIRPSMHAHSDIVLNLSKELNKASDPEVRKTRSGKSNAKLCDQ